MESMWCELVKDLLCLDSLKTNASVPLQAISFYSACTSGLDLVIELVKDGDSSFVLIMYLFPPKLPGCSFCLHLEIYNASSAQALNFAQRSCNMLLRNERLTHILLVHQCTLCRFSCRCRIHFFHPWSQISPQSLSTLAPSITLILQKAPYIS